MGTDWGYGCETCGVDEHGIVRERATADNCRDTESLARWLESPGLLEACARVREAGLVVEVEMRGWSFSDVGDFAARHLALGHVVRVCDEYGAFDGQCWRWVRCGACDERRRCARGADHEGPCAPRGTGAPAAGGGA